MFKRDNFAFGTMIGAVIPILVFLFLQEFVTIKLNNGETEPRFDDATNLVLSLVFNLIPFRQYMQKGNYEKTGKGILLMTFIYAMVYVYIKFYHVN